MSCKDSREMWMKQKDEPIRVAQIMGKLWAGGVEMVVFNYYRAIDKSKIQFDFYYDADSTVEPPQDLIDMGARFYKIPPYQKLPQYIRELKKHLKENQYLIVHSHLNTLSVFPLFVAWMCRVPVRVAHNHSVPSGKELKRDALKYFLRIFGRVFPTDYFACSEKAGRWMFGNRNYDAGKVVVIKNATDFERFRADEETIEKINKYFIIENVWEDYNPILSDPVKFNFNNEYFSENKSEFISIWLKLFVKYPKDYIEAFISNSYGYYYPEVRNSVVSRVTMDHNMGIKQTPLIDGKWVEQIDGLIDARGIPVFGFVFSIGAGVLLTVIALSYTIYKKKYKYLLVYLPTFILWLTLIASPAYCEYRYAYPIFLALPVYLGMNFIKEGNNEDGKNSSTNTLL